MKTIIILAISCLPFFSYAADEKPGPDAVVVKLLDKPLPLEVDKRDKFLWVNFANKPEEEKFSSYGANKWKDNFAAFAKSLAKKADDQKFDSASLRKALDLVLKDAKDKIAYLPVGAYQTTLDGKLIWIITVKWEYPSMGKNPELGHIRMFAFDQKILEQVGFITCN
jgi:hypothetical protein